MRRRLHQTVHAAIFAARRLPSGFRSKRFLPQVSARAVCCLDAAGNVLADVNARTKRPPASLVKLATALVLLRVKGESLDHPARIENADCVGGSTASLRPGDVVTLFDLLHGLLLPSGNDAAQAIARTVGKDLPGSARTGCVGSRFVEEMNRLAAELGLSRTRFVNPSGLDRAAQYSTAEDLARLASAAFSDPIIRRICGTASHRIDVRGDRPRRIELRSTVSTLDEPDVVCAKTGSTPGAGACLALRSEVHEQATVLVVLGSEVRFTREGMVIPQSDRRFDDARTILEEVRARHAGAVGAMPA